MRTSEQTADLYAAIIALQTELKPVGKNKTVKYNKVDFRYAPLDTIVDHLKPLFVTHGFAVLQALDVDHLTTRLVHKSGQWVESETFLNRDHANMQGFGAEVTYKRRYALSALIGIVSDDDNDAPRHKSTDGVLESLSQRRQNLITDIAEIIKEKAADGNEWGVFEEYSGVTDQEERVALWSLLPAPVRSSIKKLGEAERAKNGV